MILKKSAKCVVQNVILVKSIKKIKYFINYVAWYSESLKFSYLIIL